MPVPFFADGLQLCRSRIAGAPRPPRASRVCKILGFEGLGAALNRFVSDIEWARSKSLRVNRRLHRSAARSGLVLPGMEC